MVAKPSLGKEENMYKPEYTMWDVIPLIGIPYPESGRSSYYVSCPCCDYNSRDKHLNINLVKNVYRCPKCGISGGVIDLYALIMGVSYDKAREVLRERISLTKNPNTPQYTVPQVSEYPLTDVETRHNTYLSLLEKLSLAPDHRENLLNRGLKDEDIQRFGYKSTPLVGMSVLSKQLLTEGQYLAGVPGFYKNSMDKWTFVTGKRGILIPVRNSCGKIQGLQVRCDDVRNRKYRWISSTERKDGCKAEGWVHVVGEVKPFAVITEGPLKADVIHTLTGLTVISVPGVNTLSHLKATLEEMKSRGLCEIKTAFDMDMMTNHNVRNGFLNLMELLDSMDFKFGTYVWDSRYKGLDDYVWESLRKNN